jgi:hypothetical protein
MRAALLLLTLVLLPACTPPAAPRTFTISAQDYPRAFDLTLETVRAARFDLDRVDARGGVISTRLKPTGGLATPRDLEQQTLGQEWQDLINEQLREVRVWFREIDAHADATDALRPADDLRTATGPVEVTVEVIIHRRRKPGRQIETETIRRSRAWNDPSFTARQMQSGSTTPVRRDDDFAAKLAETLQADLAKPVPEPPVRP